MSEEDLPTIRISDHDRAEVSRQLETAFADGRIDTEELESRLKIVNRAKFRADLEATTADLPASTSADQGNGAMPARIDMSNLAVRYSPFLVAPVICTLIYAMTGFGDYFWPMWVWFGCAVPVIIDVLDPDRRGDDDDL